MLCWQFEMTINAMGLVKCGWSTVLVLKCCVVLRHWLAAKGPHWPVVQTLKLQLLLLMDDKQRKFEILKMYEHTFVWFIVLFARIWSKGLFEVRRQRSFSWSIIAWKCLNLFTAYRFVCNLRIFMLWASLWYQLLCLLRT